MTGDQADFLHRIKAVLPHAWFADETPVLDSLLGGLGAAWELIYVLLQYARGQARIGTATDFWLDIIAFDFFGGTLVRRSNEQDASFRRRIKAELFRERGTRAAVVLALTDLTGRAPVIFEPARTTDTGGYASLTGSGGGVCYGGAGAWGSLRLPFQAFVTAYRPSVGGIAQVTGWGCLAGAYGFGAIEYASIAMAAGQIADADIFATVAKVLPVATIAWTRIQN